MIDRMIQGSMELFAGFAIGLSDFLSPFVSAFVEFLAAIGC